MADVNRIILGQPRRSNFINDLIKLLKVSSSHSKARVSSEYKKSFIGVLWEVLSVLFITTFLSIVWSRVLPEGTGAHYFLYLLFGFSVWTLMSRLVDQSLAIGIRLKGGMISQTFSTNYMVWANVLYCLRLFTYLLPLVLIVSMVTVGFSLSIYLNVFASIVCILVTGWSIMNILGTLAFFSDDFARFVRMCMRVSFLLTPVIWNIERLDEHLRHYIYLNPFYSYLDVFRSALLGQDVSKVSVSVMVIQTSVLLLVGLIVYKASNGITRKSIYVENGCQFET